MRIRIVGFTKQGSQIVSRLVRGLTEAGHEASGFAPLEEPLRDWTGRCFESGTGLIFVGAVGIAVRSVAPWLAGKDRDPAVVVVDEKGRFAISLLSGHLGGANDLARMAAEILGAEPVITTATDLNGVFAVDLFAKENDLAITDLPAAKEISAALLRGETVGFFCELPIEGMLPAGLNVGERKRYNIVISEKREDKNTTGQKTGRSEGRDLLLVPRNVMLGIGCRKGAGKSAIEKAADQAMTVGGFHPKAAAGISSIDIKREEEGLRLFAASRGLALNFYTAKELASVSGQFSESEFVRQVTGVSNVCERSAVCGCAPHKGRLAVRRIAVDGVTAAAAVREKTIHF